MKGSKSKIRILSVLWILFVVFLCLFWWIATIFETLFKKKRDGKSYLQNLKTSYKDLFKEVKDTYKDFMSGERKWR